MKKGRKFLKLHEKAGNSVVVVNSDGFVCSQKNSDGSTKVTYQEDDSLTENIDVNETSEKINSLLPDTTIRLHIAEDNTVACVSIDYIRIVKRLKEKDTEVTIWDDTISVNESPEKVYDLIADAEGGVTEQIRAERKKTRKETTKKAETVTVEA